MEVQNKSAYIDTPIFAVKLVREGSCTYSAKKPPIMSLHDVVSVLNPLFKDEPAEICVMIMLSTRNHVIGVSIVSRGTLTSTLVGTREIFQRAILANAARIIVAHNHPSSDPMPSFEDAQVTRNLREAGKILGIEVVDHIIWGSEVDYVSTMGKGSL